MRPDKFAQLASFNIINNMNLLVTGAPGIGKSSILEEVCHNTIWHKKYNKETGELIEGDDLPYDLIISHPVVSDPTDYKGLPYAHNGKAEFLPYGELEKLITATRPVVYFLDDLGQAPVAVQAAVMQLLLARQVDGKKISKYVRFVAATNRKTDNAGVNGLLDPVLSRFATIVELEVNADDWMEWAYRAGMPSELINFIRWRPELLNGEEDAKAKAKRRSSMQNGVSPRTLASVGKFLNNNLPHSLEAETLAGAAGETFTTEFRGFLKIWRELPDVDVVLNNPDKAKVPTDPGTRYALTGVLSDRANKDNFLNICKYLKRMPAELGVVTIMNAVKRKKELYDAKGFIEWAVENKEIVLGDNLR